MGSFDVPKALSFHADLGAPWPAIHRRAQGKLLPGCQGQVVQCPAHPVKTVDRPPDAGDPFPRAPLMRDAMAGVGSAPGKAAFPAVAPQSAPNWADVLRLPTLGPVTQFRGPSATTRPAPPTSPPAPKPSAGASATHELSEYNTSGGSSSRMSRRVDMYLS